MIFEGRYNMFLPEIITRRYSAGESGESGNRLLIYCQKFSICLNSTMARMARAVAPGFPNHITQRGNRRQQTFFSDQDYKSYLALIA